MGAQRTIANLAEAERLRAEAEAAAQRYHDLIQGIDAIVWEADAATLRFAFVSQRAEAILGFPVAQWLAEPDFWVNHVHPDDRPHAVAICRAAVAAGRDHESEYRMLAADGRAVWIHDTCRFVPNSTGAPLLRGVLVDITSRKQAEEARTRLTAVLEATTDFVGITDVRGRVLYINRAGRKLLGIAETDDLSAVRPADYQPESTRTLMRNEALPAAIRDGVWSGESGLLIRGGREIPVSQVIIARKSATGSVEFLATIARDISERQRAEAQLAGLLDIAKDISGTLDLDEILDRVQRRTAALLPSDRVITYYWDPQRNTFRDIARYGLPEALVADAVALEFPPGIPLIDRLAGGHTVVIDDAANQPWLPLAVLDHFGIRGLVAVPLAVRGRVLGAYVAISTQPGRCFGAPQVQLLESIARSVGVAIETTELYRAQQEEAQVAAALARVGREMISALDTPVILDRMCQLATEVLGCDCSHTLLARPGEDAFVPVSGYGYCPEEWETIRVLKLPREMISAGFAHLEGDAVANLTMAAFKHLPGAALALQYGITRALTAPLRRGGQLIGMLVAADRGPHEPFTRPQERIAAGIGQLTSLALENARLVEELARASSLKSDFVATMSHELRTPLNVIVGYLDLLLDGVFGAMRSDQAETLRRVEKSARELIELINATLDVSRLEAGRVLLDSKEIRVAELVSELDAETRSLRDRPGVKFAWQVPPGLPRLRTDPVKLKVVLKNLIGNAVKFTDHGSVTVSVAPHDNCLEFTVADTGIGIAAEARAVIFEPFRQADSSMTRRHGGVGLGLYIVHRLLDMLGGTITVESELGRGSTFRVSLPIDASPSLETTQAKHRDLKPPVSTEEHR